MSINEAAFEEFICGWLVGHGGYDEVKHGLRQGLPTDFDPGLALDTAELFAFIGATQIDEWNDLIAAYGDADKAQRGFAERLAQRLDADGTMDVLRRGVVDLGVTIRLAYFRPASGLTPELVERYGKNRLTVTRQLPYEAGSTKTVDLCLFVNGIPVATAELKNAQTGQGLGHAIAQYRIDRDPKNRTLRRAVVHFAVDTERVAMTTRLAGKDTRFLPFDRGHDMGAGNPPNPDDHRTAYLWERVWQRDAWLDLLQRFVHVEPAPKGSRAPARVVFPRFHQWDAVLALTDAARTNGAGTDYLVQHSAGSGKSNTIAWLAHRLSSLHDADDTKVFDKVVVITDRRVLDKQLQETIYQIDHTRGVVVRIDQDSQQLAKALAGEQARIVITTLQKFPFVTEKIGQLPQRRYAVIVDEAHSSQTGESATALKGVLGAKAVDDDDVASPSEDALARSVAARGRQPNLSFFAFTATPKGRTLELFGRYNPVLDKNEPFHLYSMRQAIEEGFILDVLAHYVTYKTYWQIEQARPDDPEYDPRQARAAIARFVDLHPHQLAQKAEVIIEHFRAKVRHKIGGMAKAMVVTSSREHAARYKLALDKYVNAKGYTDVGVLVAFSGKLDLDGDGDTVTESSMNGFPESQTPAEFDTAEWQVLVVAEKYQTGFDQPKLYAMYVDKPLTGLAAVQTLSRLNRTYDRDGIRKDGTFVLDFRNDADAIREAFEPWYGETVAPPTDPNLLYDTRRALDAYGVLRQDEVERVVSLLMTRDTVVTARVHAALAPAVDRFRHELDDDEQTRFRDALNRFLRTYAFLSQVVAFTDAGLERDYLYGKALAALLRDDGYVAVHPDVELTHLKIEQTFSGSVSLTNTTGEVVTVFGGTGKVHEPQPEPLSAIIQKLNDRYGTNFDPRDRLFHVAADKLTDDPEIQQAAVANSPDAFKLIAGPAMLGKMVEQIDVAEAMAFAYIDNEALRNDVLTTLLPFIQGRSLVKRQEHCDIVDLLGPEKESTSLEYKATLRTHQEGGELFKPLESASLKTIAAFMNSEYGGTLLIGVANDGTVHGLESDYASFSPDKRPGQDHDPRDRFQLHLAHIVSASMGDAAATNVRAYVHHVDGHDLCRVQVDPSAFPVEAKVTYQKPNQPKETRTEFFVRVGNSTKPLNDAERTRFILKRWGPTAA